MMRTDVIRNAVFCFVLTIALLLTTGCSCIFHSDVPYGPQVTGDGNGGAIIFYEESGNKDKQEFLVQKISPAGKRLWDDGIYIADSYSRYINYWTLKMASDCSGGAFISWETVPSSEEQTFSYWYIARIDDEGKILWQKKTDAIYDIISDRSAGAFVITQNVNSDSLLLNRIDKEGNYLWVEGITLTRSGYSPIKMTGDGAGGLIIYEEMASTLHSLDMRIKRLDSSGNWLLEEYGIKLTIEAGEQSAPHNPFFISGDRDTFIVVWTDIRHGLASLYAQKYDYAGAVKWQPDGIKVCFANTNASFWPVNVVSDGAGGAIVTCSYKEADTGQKIMLAQKLDDRGRTLWGENGITVISSPHSAHSLAYDGSGGAVIGWGTDSMLFSPSKSYVQRIDVAGSKLWGDDGIKLTQ